MQSVRDGILLRQVYLFGGGVQRVGFYYCAHFDFRFYYGIL